MKNWAEKLVYRNIAKPVLFSINPEIVHERYTNLGQLLGESYLGRRFVGSLYKYENKKLEKDVLGIHFNNPVGLAAGFDYDAKLLKIIPEVGFGFETAGTVTNLPYEGNKKPRLVRLPKSKSILVNKGFKSDGVDVVLERLDDRFLKDVTFGISVGVSNVPQINTISKAITDCVECFNKLKTNPYIKYFELNISCPNTLITESFLTPDNFKNLILEVSKLNTKRPIFIKMPNELDLDTTSNLIDVSLSNNIRGFVFSNLVKNRSNEFLNTDEINTIKNLKGNFSGLPTKDNSNKLIKFSRERYGENISIVGLGGIFSIEDAKLKFKLGADLVQLITGMIYQGPQLISEINRGLLTL